MQDLLLFIKPAIIDFGVTWGQRKQAINTCNISGKYNMHRSARCYIHDILSPFKLIWGTSLADNCVFTHPTDADQNLYSFTSCVSGNLVNVNSLVILLLTVFGLCQLHNMFIFSCLRLWSQASH